MVDEEYYIPPTKDEFEFSLFGPGYGESILLHLGNNHWITIDSCTGKEKSVPAPLEYFKDIKVDPAQTVKKIIATHWHDDHVKGLSQIVKSCPYAEFICSDALGFKEFSFILEDDINIVYPVKMKKPLKEFTQIAEHIADLDGYIRFTKGVEIIDRENDYSIVVYSLSPSAKQVSLFREEFIKGYREKIPLIELLDDKKPNHASVVLLIEIGEISLLLGADLEQDNANQTGWSEIVTDNERPPGKSKLFKVAHHGSHNGDIPQIWTDLLENAPITILTPWNLGRNKLPRETDIQRIFKNTPNLYITRNILNEQENSELSQIRPGQNSLMKNRQPLKKSGHIRLRKKLSDPKSDWKIELFYSAQKLAGDSV